MKKRDPSSNKKRFIDFKDRREGTSAGKPATHQKKKTGGSGMGEDWWKAKKKKALERKCQTPV